MAELDLGVLVLGLSRGDESAPLGINTVIYWVPQKGDNGYFIDVAWNSDGSIKAYYGLRGHPIDEPTGISIEGISLRDPNGWYWSRNPQELIPFGTVVAISHEFYDYIRKIDGEGALSQFTVEPEMYDRDVYLCFGTHAAVYSYLKKWHGPVTASVDSLFSKYLRGEEDPQLIKMINWLPFFLTTLDDFEQYLLRYLLYTSPDIDDEVIKDKVAFMSHGNRAGYQFANMGGSLKRDKQNLLIVPPEMVFASTENAKKALVDLVKKISAK